MNRRLAVVAALFVWIVLLPGSAVPQGSVQKDTPQFTLSTTTEEVLVNVTVRDKQGNFVKDLKKEDFTILEEGRPQQVLSMDIENTDAVVNQGVQIPNLLENLSLNTAPAAPAAPKPAPQALSDTVFRDRRLVVLFFDLSSMQPEEIIRSSKSALDYIDNQMGPADLVAVVTLTTELNVDEDFTSNKDELKDTINSFNPDAGQGNELGTDGDTTQGDDTGAAYVADDTESNIVNTDVRLLALQNLATTLGGIQQKKSVIYFASGMTRTGVENQSALRAATAAAVRANLSLYPVDARGLMAIVPGGDATKASQRGSAAYTGRAMQSAYSSLSGSQETLVTLASDTGGKAFLDNNDFKPAFTKMLDDTAMYYVLAYRSSNPARDGRYRRITVSVNKRPDLKLDFRHGYYAAADFQHSTKEDREQQLQDQLTSNLPSTDLPVYLSSGYFRLAETRYFVPVSLVVPASAIPFTKAGDQDRATLDIAGVVRDQGRRPFYTTRETVKLAVNTTQEVKRKNVQYDTGYLLPPGVYHLKFVLRENQTGQVGSFETDVTVPNLKDAPFKISSVIASSQKQTAKPKKDDPLIRNGSELVPSVTHVFTTAQHLYLYYEIYEPNHEASADPKTPIRLLTNVTFFKGNARAFETPLVEVNQIGAPDRKAAEVELDVPLASLKPGFYTCQVNVVDAVAGRFVFPRLALLVR